MLELSWIAETVRVWLEGGDFAAISATPGFGLMLTLAAFVVVPSLILVSLNAAELHQTWLGKWLGAAPPDEDWKHRACDIDKDGLADF
jgi:hypothetical protein